MEKLQPGEIVDSFRIEKELHVSAVATLYKAEDLINSSSVVLKIPLIDLINNPALIYHHQNESRIGRLLHHHQIVRFLDRYKSHQYSVMEYIDGHDLRHHLTQRKKLDLDDAIDIFCQVAAACSYIHSKEIVHLDIKPENIMITREGGVKIIDFGLSHELGYGDYFGLDFTGAKGTPYYISPEQLCGLRHIKQSDIYCLAMVFYEMLTGKLPFEKSTSLNKVRERLKLDPVPPRYYDKEIPPAIQDVILSCLQRNPDDRPQSLTDCVKEMKNYPGLTSGRYGDIVTRPIAFLSYFNYFDAAKTKKSYAQQKKVGDLNVSISRQILGCVADNESSDAVVDWLRREVILSGGNITLLHVIEDDSSNEFEKYAHEVEGISLSERLSRYLTYLNRYDIFPLLRIKRGNAADIITETARELPADHIVVGRPRHRSRISKIFTGSVMEKIVEAELTNVTVVQSVNKVVSPDHVALDDFTYKEVNNLELFLLECWAEHADLIRDMEFLQTNTRVGTSEMIDHCRMTQWLLQLPNMSKKIPGVELILELDARFHVYVSDLQGFVFSKERDKADKVYGEHLYPLLAEMKKNIHSLVLKIKTDFVMQRGTRV